MNMLWRFHLPQPFSSRMIYIWRFVGLNCKKKKRIRGTVNFFFFKYFVFLSFDCSIFWNQWIVFQLFRRLLLLLFFPIRSFFYPFTRGKFTAKILYRGRWREKRGFKFCMTRVGIIHHLALPSAIHRVNDSDSCVCVKVDMLEGYKLYIKPSKIWCRWMEEEIPYAYTYTGVNEISDGSFAIDLWTCFSSPSAI